MNYVGLTNVASRAAPPSGPNAIALRVALFSGNYNYVRDGANNALNRLVGYLGAHGVAVRVYAPTVARPAFAPTGDLVSVPSIAVPGRGEYRLGLGLPRAVRSDLAAFAPTLLHVSAPDMIGRAAQRFARERGLPVVASYHTRFESYLRYYGLDALEPLAIAYLRRFYRRCDQLLAPEESLALSLRMLGFNDNVRIWSRGVDRARFSPVWRDETWRARLGFAPDTCVVVFVGRLVREKGLTLLGRIFDRLQGRTCIRLLVVGDGPERGALAARLPRAAFVGHLDGEALSRAYASADVFINPSSTEAFGNVNLEAMASGLPVVCAHASGNRALVTPGISGLLCNAADPDSFANAVVNLADAPDLRHRLGLAGRARSARYDWNTVLGSVLANYRHVVAGVAAPSEEHRAAGAIAARLILGKPGTAR